MNQILTLREKRAKAWDAAKAFLDTKRGTDGLLSAEDVATYEKMEADVVSLGKEIDRLERQASLDRELSQPTTNPITNQPAAGGKAKDGRASDEYTRSFWALMRNKSVSHEVYNALKIGQDDHGGFLAPDEFQRTLLDALQEQNIFRQLAHVITTSSGDRKIPVVASKGTAAWIDEEAAYPESDDTFGLVSISAYKLATMIKVSEELLNDGVFDIAAYIATEFARRIGAAEEEAFFTGNGTGKPTGILNATGGAELGVTTAGATAITMDEVMDLFYSLRSPYRRNANFLMNDATVKALRKLKNASGDYIWQPSVTAGAPDTILNRPVYTSAFMPTIAGGAKSILFGDLGYENLTSQIYTQSVMDYANAALIGGEGEGISRVLASIAETIGEARREVFVDAKDLKQEDFGAGYTAALLYRGLNRLSELSMAHSFDAEVNPHGNLRYKVDFDLGQTVTVLSKKWGVTLSARITEIQESYDASGLVLNIVFGKGALSLLQKLKGG